MDSPTPIPLGQERGRVFRCAACAQLVRPQFAFSVAFTCFGQRAIVCPLCRARCKADEAFSEAVGFAISVGYTLPAARKALRKEGFGDVPTKPGITRLRAAEALARRRER